MLRRLRAWVRRHARLPLWLFCAVVAITAVGFAAWSQSLQREHFLSLAATHSAVADGFREGQRACLDGGFQLRVRVGARDISIGASRERLAEIDAELAAPGLTTDRRVRLVAERERLHVIQSELDGLNRVDATSIGRYMAQAERFAAVAAHRERLAQTYESAAANPGFFPPPDPPQPSLDP